MGAIVGSTKPHQRSNSEPYGCSLWWLLLFRLVFDFLGPLREGDIPISKGIEIVIALPWGITKSPKMDENAPKAMA
jgi:hypothetical protein